MLYLLKLDDFANISYVVCKTKIKEFVFTYEGRVNGITNKFTYEIFFDGEHNNYIIKTFCEDDIVFDTYKDCETYIYKKIHDLKNKLDIEQNEIEKYINKKNKRKNKNKEENNGNKKC